MPWHPVPSRAACTYLRYGYLRLAVCLSNCVRRFPLLFYKETAFCFDCLFCFLQWRIPHRMCRFYFLLAGAVEERQGISIPYPSPTPLLTPLGIRCGGALLLPRAWGNLGICIPVLSLLASSGFYLAVCVRAGIVRVSVGLSG